MLHNLTSFSLFSLGAPTSIGDPLEKVPTILDLLALSPRVSGAPPGGHIGGVFPQSVTLDLRWTPYRRHLAGPERTLLAPAAGGGRGTMP